MEQKKTIWTIGHSTRTFDEFLTLLTQDAVARLIDVRRYPGSRKFPHFNSDVLEKSLVDNKIKYTHLEALGGRRKVSPESKNTVWNHPSFRGYADYMETSEFNEAFRTLEALASKSNCAIMCSEAVWWRCHRSMISDQLKANGWTVIHILGENQHQEHPFTKPAQIIDGHLTYH